MSARWRLLELMRRHPKGRFTDGELAAYTGLPEPSVRRARLQLERSGYIDYAEDFAMRATWRITLAGVRAIDLRTRNRLQ